ncbi:hypothetical protein [Magnetovirga frankeli]|uniref:hypothetical protein n=1 Tax=Magnetovirga frankeli TaxID=947516 RepID=UPI003D346A44
MAAIELELLFRFVIGMERQYRDPDCANGVEKRLWEQGLNAVRIEEEEIKVALAQQRKDIAFGALAMLKSLGKQGDNVHYLRVAALAKRCSPTLLNVGGAEVTDDKDLHERIRC